MRKYLFLALAATALLAGCNKQKPEFSIYPEDFGDSDKVRISFNTNTVETKAMIDGDQWNGGEEIILVGAVKYSENDEYEVGDIVFPEGGMPTSAPYGIAGTTQIVGYKTAIYLGTKFYYYIDKVSYDFYGYYLGDAEAKSWADGKLTFALPDNADADIMVAKADPSSDVLNATKDLEKMNIAPYNILYSSRSARRGVVPHLQFEHALTAITVTAIKGLDVEDEIIMKYITVNAKKEGTLTVIGSEQVAEAISPETSQFRIPTGTGITLPVHPGEGNESQLQTNSEELGTFLLFPGEDEYKVKLEFSQDGTDVTAEIKVKAPSEGFQAGTHYNVTLVVYNNHEIEFTTSIKEWTPYGDPIIVDPDDF